VTPAAPASGWTEFSCVPTLIPALPDCSVSNDALLLAVPESLVVLEDFAVADVVPLVPAPVDYVAPGEPFFVEVLVPDCDKPLWLVEDPLESSA